MKKLILVPLIILFYLPSFSQVNDLVADGVALHDKGEYAAALAKYDEAIKADPTDINALYEKSYTLYAAGRKEECIELSKQMIKQFPGHKVLSQVYVQYGTCLDDLGQPKEALKIYNKGLKKFSDNYLLHFNKGITYLMMDDNKKAYASFQDALIINPLHASSYLRVAELLQFDNHIPSILSGIMFLVLEPQSERSGPLFKTLQKLLFGNVQKTGDNSVTIFLSPSMLDSKKHKKDPDNFRTQELLFAMSASLDKDSTMNAIAKTEFEKFDLRLQLLINSLTENQKGFFSQRYVPFFKEMKEKNFTLMASRLVYKNTFDERNAAWLKTNTGKVTEFYQWLQQYQWPVK